MKKCQTFLHPAILKTFIFIILIRSKILRLILYLFNRRNISGVNKLKRALIQRHLVAVDAVRTVRLSAAEQVPAGLEDRHHLRPHLRRLPRTGGTYRAQRILRRQPAYLSALNERAKTNCLIQQGH